MKMVKSLLLGAAAGVVGVAGAQAADLPVKAKPVQYVKICSLYGAGFYYMPGTDTCLKVGGFVRAEMNFNANTSFGQINKASVNQRTYNFTNTRARAAVTLDARSQTEYGTLRAYALIAEQIDTGTPFVNPQGLGGSDVRTWSNAFFIQFAGFTAGATASFFDFDLQPYSNQTNVLSSNAAGAGIPVFAYTAQFGNGLSASISAEANEGRRSHILNATATTTGIPVSTWGDQNIATNAGTATLTTITGNQNGYAGRQWPDVVGNLRLDQAWGSAQVMGAVHQLHANSYDMGGFTAAPSDKVGWAVGGGLKVNLPMLGKGDYVIAQVGYTEGALAYVGSGLPGIGGATAASGINYGAGSAGPGFLIGTGNPATSGYGPVFDATYGLGGDLQLTKAWSVTGGYEHFWNTQWKTSLYGSYAKFDYNDVASAQIASTAAAQNGGVAGMTGTADWSFWQVGSRTVWTPVTNLDLSVDVLYNHIDTAYSTTAALGDKGWLAGMFRAQRNFYP